MKTHTVHSFKFDSLAALVQWHSFNPTLSQYKGKYNGRGDDELKFCGGATYQETLELTRKGWPKGLAKMVEATANAMPAYVATPSHTFDVAGAFPIAALAAAGEPCNMWTPTLEEIKTRPIIKLGVNIWVSGAYSATEITNYGAAILSYVNALETAQMRVELSALVHCQMVYASDHAYNIEVIAKQAEEHMDLDRLAFMFSHPAMFRRMIMGHRMAEPSLAHLNVSNGTVLPMPKRDDMLTLGGLNNFAEPGDPILKDPKAIAHRLGNTINAHLSELGHEPPAIVWGQKTP